MASTGGERSLSSGISFPQWMKNKMIDNRLDLDQSTFSPPEHDDTFLYIRYPRHNNNASAKDQESSKYTPITDLLDRNKISADYKNHTLPCQEFINGAKKPKQPSLSKIVKSNGTDDGFKGDGAACGTSVVRVAHQMVVTHGFNPVQSNKNTDDEPATAPVGFDASVRRGSRSLPASPLSKRKNDVSHKYFTGAFVDGPSEKYQGSWILAGLLNKRENLSKSVTTLSDEEKTDDEVLTEKKKSTSQVFRAKPSELREMNFWSPTSM